MNTIVRPRAVLSMSLKLGQPYQQKNKVVFVIGPTGTGKSRLAIDLASQFPAEVINCDKIQVHKGLDIATNKVTMEEQRGVPHHFLGSIGPDVDLPAEAYSLQASDLIGSLACAGKLPVVAGGSTSYVEALARANCDCCFLWVDVSLPVLYSFVSRRVDKMVREGLVEEVREAFDFNRFDYSRGIRRAIGVPELDFFFRHEARLEGPDKCRVLDNAISRIKDNTCLLAYRQLQKIQRLQSLWFWNMHRIDATEVFLKTGDDADEAWERLVAAPSAAIVHRFLSDRALVPSVFNVEFGAPKGCRALASSGGRR